MSLKCMAAKNLNFNIQRWRTAAVLKIEKLQNFMMMQNRSLKLVGRPPSWIVKIKFLSGNAFERHVLHHYTKFCRDRSYCCRDITIFHIFLVKCKNSTDDRAYCGITLLKLEIIK